MGDHEIGHDAARFAGRGDLLVVMDGGADAQAADDADADHYSLALRYPTADAQQTVSGSVTMSARATQALSQFDLDFAGDSVDSVSVDGRPAAWTWSDEELAITPAQALHDHEKFVVRVDYTAHTSPPAPGAPSPSS